MNMNIIIDIINVIVLGIIEGITEFLPVSSTGHLILAEEIFTLEPKGFANAFMVIIQLGAILSVIVLNFNRLNPFSKRYLTDQKLDIYKRSNPQTKGYILIRNADKSTLKLWMKIIVAVIPAGVLGYLFDDLIDAYLFNPITVSIALIFYGFIIIFIEKRNVGKTAKTCSFNELTYADAFKIGLFQCLAMVPGTSRSAATIIGALLLGTSRVVATEFSFYLAIPTMIGATLLKLVKNFGSYSLYQWFLIALGFIVSYFVAYMAIKKFVDYVKKHDFKVFGYYRIVLGIIVLLVMRFVIN